MKKVLYEVAESARILLSYAIYRLSGKKILTATARKYRQRALTRHNERLAAAQALQLALDNQHQLLRGWDRNTYSTTVSAPDIFRDALLQREFERTEKALNYIS